VGFVPAGHVGVGAHKRVRWKGLGGGLPLAAVLLDAKAAEGLAPGVHGTTFGGNPVATTAGLWVVERVLRKSFLARVRRRGKTLKAALATLVAAHPKSLSESRGLGLLAAIEVAEGAPFGPKDLVEAARAEGLLLVRGGDRALRVLPPLDVDEKTIAEAMACLDRALTRLEETKAS